MRKLKSLSLNGLVLAALVAGLIYEVEGAMNVVSVFICFVLVMSFFMNSKTSIEHLKKLGAPAFPMWVHATFDVFVIMLLAWHGRFFLAAAWAISAVLCAAAWKEARSECEASQ